MSCTICRLKDEKVRLAIEKVLNDNLGIFTEKDKAELSKQFPESANEIDSISDQDCQLHWNFHQASAHEPVHYQRGDDVKASVAADIGKDEAEVLYDMLNKQAATFNVLTKKIDDALSEKDVKLEMMIINPATAQLYLDTSRSIRDTVASIRDLNVSLNGAKDGASEGLKALATAIAAGVQAGSQTDQTTKEYDD